MESNLELIAQRRIDDPMHTWPDHNRCHRMTIMNNWLFDYDCLRCWLERVATEKYQPNSGDGPPGKEPFTDTRIMRLEVGLKSLEVE